MKHQIIINITDGRKQNVSVLKGAEMSLPGRIVKLLFGDYRHVFLMTPGQTVESVKINEV